MATRVRAMTGALEMSTGKRRRRRQETQKTVGSPAGSGRSVHGGPEENLLQGLANGDPAALVALLEDRQHQIHALSAEYAGHGATREDLAGEGTAALLCAAPGLARVHHGEFWPHAVFAIRAGMRKAISDSAPIRLPRRVIAAMREHRKLWGNTGSEPSGERHPDEPGFAAAIAGSVNLQWSKPPVSLDSPQTADAPLTLHEVIPDEHAAAPDQQVMAQELAGLIARILTPGEWLVVKYSYGLDDAPILETAEIAQKLGVTPGRVRQLRLAALEQMRGTYTCSEAGRRLPATGAVRMKGETR